MLRDDAVKLAVCRFSVARRGTHGRAMRTPRKRARAVRACLAHLGAPKPPRARLTASSCSVPKNVAQR
eukprot:4230450-Lingulodinium_polyedra.AAC.1